MKKFTGRVMFGLAAAMMLLLTGCGDTDCYVISRDAKGIKAKAPVVWQDAYVGKVSAVETDADGTKISLGVKSEFADKIRAGVAARIVLDDKISAMPFVLLVGGKDEKMPVLADGAQIPEASPAEDKGGLASLVQWAKDSSHATEKAGGGLLLVLLIVLRFVKRLVKLVIKLVILAVIVLTVLAAKQDFSAYQDQINAAKSHFQTAQSWVTAHADQLKKLIQQND